MSPATNNNNTTTTTSEHSSPSSHQRPTRTDTFTTAAITTMNSVQRHPPPSPLPNSETVASQPQLPLLSIFPPHTSNPTTTMDTTSTTMMMMTPPQPVQLTGIVYPHPHDVLCGRGGQSNVHPGNTQWRMLVATNKELYVTLPKKQKMMLAHSIVNAVRSQIPPGRFLQKDVQNDLWYDVGDKRAQEKTSQALREGAPEIRTKINTATSPTNKSSNTEPAISMTIAEGSHSLSSQEIITEKESNDVPNTTSSSQDNAMTEDTIEILDPAVIVPPIPLGHATSKEQMPPPSTIPSSATIVTHNINSMKSEKAQATPKATSSSTSNTNVPAMVDDNYDDETPLPPALVPMPMFYHESQATCSFGSMALMSDMDQARLMQSFMAPSYDYRPKYDMSGQSGTYSTATVSTDNTSQYHGNSTNSSSGVYFNSNSQHQQQYQSSMSQPYNQYPLQGSNTYDYIQHQQQHGPAATYYQNSDVGNYTPAQYHTHAPPPLQDVRMPQPVDGGLDPASGFSMGSMMSIGACSKLEDTGFSFGSAMSCTPIPVNTTDLSRPSEQNGRERYNDQQSASARPPDGGLQDVGTSFGSLSIADGERERIISDADRDMARLNDFMNQGNRSSNHTTNHSGIAIPTTFLHQQKSRGSLLACNDEEDEGEDATSAEARSQKGAHEWNKLQATLAMQDQSIRDAVSVPPMFVMNPTNYQRQQQPNGSSSYHQNNFDVPTLDRDYSQMSAISVGEDFEAPPMPRMAATTSRYYSSSSAYNDNTNTVSTESIENDPNWDQYESGIRQELMMPPVLKKSYTNRY